MTFIEIIKETTPFLSVLVALIAVFFGPVITATVTRRQIVAPIRQKWINEVRELISEFMSTVHSISVMNDTQSIVWEETEDKTLHRRLLYIEHKLALMLNPLEEKHKAMIEAVGNLSEDVFQGETQYGDIGHQMKEIRELAQSILKEEWVRVKYGRL